MDDRHHQGAVEGSRHHAQQKGWSRGEKPWTLLIASLLAEARGAKQRRLVRLLSGEEVGDGSLQDVWFEAEPLPPRKGIHGDSEGNTRVDIAFGAIQRRDRTRSGIKYGPHNSGSWVCFVEAKCLSDCSNAVTYDPIRNQLARVIENLLCFQCDGQFPDRMFFTLLTPRLLHTKNRFPRLYGYKMQEYRSNPETLLEDIRACRIDKR